MNLHLKKAGKLNAESISTLALMGALMFASKVVLASLPNVHIIAVLIILSSLFFGWNALWSVVIYILLEGFFYGFGLWWLSYWYAWPLLCVISIILRKNDSAFLWSVVAAIHGLLFGALTTLPYIFLNDWRTAVSIWAAGIPFDLLHGVGNFVITFVLYRPLYGTIRRITGIEAHGK